MMNCPISLKYLFTANIQLGLGCCEIAVARMAAVSSVGRSEKEGMGSFVLFAWRAADTAVTSKEIALDATDPDRSVPDRQVERGKLAPQAQHPPSIEDDSDNVIARGFDDTNDIPDRRRPAATGGPRRMHHMQNNWHRCARRRWLLRASDVASESPWVDTWEETNGGSWYL